MPLHDWTRVPSGLFHHFHQSWSVRIVESLNAGRLPAGLIALVEQRSGPSEPDVLAIETGAGRGPLVIEEGGVAVMDPPKTQMIQHSDKEIDVYAARANRIVIRHHLGRVLAVIEIVSPGNKDSYGAVRSFVDKTVRFIREGIHVLVVDLFPPTPRDPVGIHKVIWDEIAEEPFDFPAGNDRLLVSYEAGYDRTAYIETLAEGDVLPDMPLFLADHFHIPIPLEATYMATWEVSPKVFRHAVETGELPA